MATQTAAFTSLGYSITKGDVDAVTSLLDSSPHFQLLAAKDYAENTALHLAAVGPDSRVLRELLSRGASVHVRNRAGNTPLFLAEKVGNATIVELLREAGALLHPEEVERRMKLKLSGGDSGAVSEIEGEGGKSSDHARAGGDENKKIKHGALLSVHGSCEGDDYGGNNNLVN